MKKKNKPLSLLGAAIIVILVPLSPLEALEEGPVFSGVAESVVGAVVNNNNRGYFGAEQYANLRMEAKIGDTGSFFAAFNVLATGTPETGLMTDGEVERLYVLLETERADIRIGLLRIPFGYGSGIRPTDIINPQNPLYPDARLKGVLASLVSWYLTDDFMLQGFAVQRNATYFEGQRILESGESLFGLSLDRHDALFSVQSLALCEIPGSDSHESRVHFGFSAKFDAVVGIAIDALVTTDGKTAFSEGQDRTSVSAALGCDYSFCDGKVFTLVQYYYHSAGILDADDAIPDYSALAGDSGEVSSFLQIIQGGNPSFLRRHYGFFLLQYNHSDYARLQCSVLGNLTDTSFLSTIRHELEPVQGVTLLSTLIIPLDQTVFGGSEAGEYGPDTIKTRIAGSFSVKYRF